MRNWCLHIPRQSRAVLFAALLAANPAKAEVRVIDGDTLEVAGQITRLNGIDAPEVGQSCASPRGAWSCGKEAATELLALVEGQDVRCDHLDTDRYERVIATCFVGEVDLGSELVAAGLAWAFRRYSTDYVEVEEAAKAAERGIWQGDTQPPWEFREAQWQAAINTSPRPGCPIKGNISQHGQIYHTPWSPWYSRTVISESKGERWFCDEAEALRAGWRAPYWP